MNQKISLGLSSDFMDLDDPLKLFKIWMEEAKKTKIGDPTALSLATSNNAYQPDVRMVLLKGASSKGFVFYTNLESSKGKDLKTNPKAAMCFYWESINRQVRILGNVTKVEDKEADLYFNSRPYESKISAWASSQSRPMKGRSELLKEIENFKKKYKINQNIPRPPHWSGWNLNPISIEFWLHKDHRIHERLKYKKVGRVWEKEILYP